MLRKSWLSSFSFHGSSPPEIEKLNTLQSPWISTLFWPASMSASGQLLVGQTLYERILAHGATPEIGKTGGGVRSVPTLLPPDALEVWVPRATGSVGSGPLHNAVTSVLAQSRTLTSLGGSVVP